MIEREVRVAEGAQAGRRRDLQPPPRRDAAADRRDDPLRENNFTKPLTESDLQLDSPYNTYTNSGLPPTPIGNPGLASIEAAAHPRTSTYLYYVVKPNTCGQHTFATT